MSTTTPNKSAGSKTLPLVVAALFAAISLAVKPFEIYLLPVARLNFVSVPIIMAGAILGPIWGGAVGLIADIGGFLLFDKSGQAINPILTVSNIMLGVIPGLIFAIKNDKIKPVKLTAMNISSYFVLLCSVILLLIIEGSVKISDGLFYVMSPSSGDWSPVAWLWVGVIAAAFAIYSITIILMFSKKNQDSETRLITTKVLFTVTLSIIVCDILISGLGLGIQYGWPLTLMLIVRILKGFVTIPLYTTLCIVILQVVKRTRFKI